MARADGELSLSDSEVTFVPFNEQFGLGPYRFKRNEITTAVKCLGKGVFYNPQVLAARMNMHLMGIGINDPFNGTWLINFMRNKKFDWATKSAPPHRKLHRKHYESWIGNALDSRSNTTTRSHFLNKLRSVKQHIKTGTIAEYIVDYSDTLWKGL